MIDVNLEQAHIDEAIRQLGTGKGPSRCCPVYQALTAAGYDVVGVGYTHARLRNEGVLMLDCVGRDITARWMFDWNLLTPHKFGVTPCASLPI